MIEIQIHHAAAPTAAGRSQTPPGAIHEIRLARPPVNALNPDLLVQLRDALRAAPGNGAAGIVVSGGPNVFSAGLDVPHLLTLERDALAAAWRAFFEAALTIAHSPIPVVAAIGGHSPAGGCVLALCCDYRVMARSPDPAKPFRIGLNEVQVGLVVPEGVQHLMRRVIGTNRAERLMVSGTMVDTDTALALGLIDEATGLEQVTARAVAWLQALLALPRQPQLQTRAIARADLVAAMQPERIQLQQFIDAWFAPDTQAGLHALVARLGK